MTAGDVVLVVSVVAAVGVAADRVACVLEARRLDRYRRDPRELRLARLRRDAIERAAAGRSGRGPR